MNVQAPRPSTGPHKLNESLPLVLILRNRLKYALNKKECQMICMQRMVKVDGKIRTDENFPAGFMGESPEHQPCPAPLPARRARAPHAGLLRLADVISLEASNDKFRLLYDVKGRYKLHPIDDNEGKFKLCRVNKVQFTNKSIPYLVTHDGRTIRYPDPAIKVNDTIKLDIATGKILSFVKFDVGNTCMITKGRNAGRVGVMTHRDRCGAA